LQQIRKKHLSQALSSAVAELRVSELDGELAPYAKSESLSILARNGLRGETFFAIPLVLQGRTELLGYIVSFMAFRSKSFTKAALRLSDRWKPRTSSRKQSRGGFQNCAEASVGQALNC
jgi:XcyI restriction endonuclease